MLVLIALVCLLLCVRVSVQLEASFVNGQGSAALCVGTLGLRFRRDYVLVRGEHVFSLRLKPTKGRLRRKKKNRRFSRFLIRLIKKILLDALRSGRFERIRIRLNLGDACETAIAAGMARALLCALLVGGSGAKRCDLIVTPEFGRPDLCIHADGVFSCRASDIALSALKAARGKRKACAPQQVS